MRKLHLIAGVAILAVSVAACGGGAKVNDTGASAAPSAAAPSGGSAAPSAGGTVKLAVNPWVGYEADAAVISYLLQNELGYTVEKKELAEEPSWQGMESGDVDVILENWGHDDLKQKYIDDKGVAVALGPNGNKGVIGWYVPEWMATKYPDITDYKNLNKYADMFKTSESGGKGQLLDGDPSYVTNDEALVKNLKLNFKVVFGGSEDALIKAAKQATAQQKPLLMYFYEPQWLFSQLKLVKVNLPAYTKGCDADPKKIACDYPPYELDKIVSKKFQDSGGKAFELIKNFQWTNEDQNQVADDITNNGMSDEAAAKKWVDAHPDVWKAWLPQ
ncbi:ABC transporter substrate-binding protein [Streptosporangiaceae bacterium NEAU-GS5]|nr:ABC transporter substrate-binding protein [Streptosporangiaceae bacterium NEAU-GS5]